MEAVDKLLADTEATLAAEHLTDKTYIVFSSDNGYHLGQHRLDRGKQTAFDTDIRVPLIVAGPGVPHGGRLAGRAERRPRTRPSSARRRQTGAASRRPQPRAVPPPRQAHAAWRTVALVEHHGDDNDPADPDFEGGGSNPTTYEAIRISAKQLPGFDGPVEAVYVEYEDRPARNRVLRHQERPVRADTTSPTS